MKRKLNSWTTYFKTGAISQRAAKAQQEKSEGDRDATKNDWGKTE